MKLTLFFSAAVLGLVALSNSISAAQIDWAGVASANASNAAGPPDSNTVAGAAVTSTFNAFGVGTGNSTSYSDSSLASFLGITTAQLAQGDFIAFEVNGTTGGTFESGTWTFSDGTNNFNVTHTFGNTAAQDGAGVLALGHINPINYTMFFNTTNSPPLDSEMVYILFDIGSASAVNLSSPSFNVTLVSPGGSTGTPDMDALGRLAVPEPNISMLSAVGLLVLSLGSYYFRRRPVSRVS